MHKAKFRIVALTAICIAGSTVGLAQTGPDPHHDGQDTSGATALPAPPAPGMPMMDMSAMMNMMQMMHMGGRRVATGAMSHSCMDGMNVPARVEGYIAFLRAELKISDAQVELWNAFADVLRSSAKQTKESGGMSMMAAGGNNLVEKMEAQEKALGACLEMVKAERAALVLLHAALSEEQRKTLEDLLGPQMGMMGPGMMQGGMMQGGTMPGFQ